MTPLEALAWAESIARIAADVVRLAREATEAERDLSEAEIHGVLGEMNEADERWANALARLRGDDQ